MDFIDLRWLEGAISVNTNNSTYPARWYVHDLHGKWANKYGVSSNWTMFVIMKARR